MKAMIIQESASYPNPAKDNLNISSTISINRINVFNIYGQLVKSDEVDSENFIISTDALAGGIYFIQLFTNDDIFIKKIVVRK